MTQRTRDKKISKEFCHIAHADHAKSMNINLNTFCPACQKRLTTVFFLLLVSSLLFLFYFFKEWLKCFG